MFVIRIKRVTPLIKRDLQRIPGIRFDRKRNIWYTPFASEFLNAFSRKWMGSLSPTATTELNQKVNKPPPPTRELGITLLPFQRDAVQKMVEVLMVPPFSFFLLDATGVGKTIETLATLHFLGKEAFQTLVVCPFSLKLHWKWQANMCLPDRIVQVLSSKKDRITEADIIIANYDIIGAITHPEIFKTIVFDESYLIKNAEADRTKMSKDLSDKAPKTKIILITATPMPNRPAELVTQFQVLRRFETISPSWTDYIKRYCKAEKTKSGWNIQGSSNTTELIKKMRKFSIGRTKDEVMPWLKEKTRTIVPIQMSELSFDPYEQAETEIMQWIEDNRDNPQSLMAAALVRIEKLKAAAAKAKLKTTIQFISKFSQVDEPVVVFCNHLDIVDDLVKHFKFPKLTGDDSEHDRDIAVSEFQEGRSNGLIVTAKTGGVGLSFTRGTNGIVVELGWSPGEMEQIESRLYRMGQKNAVNFWYLVAQGTIEESIIELLNRKLEVIQSITDIKEKELVANESILKELMEKLMK